MRHDANDEPNPCVGVCHSLVFCFLGSQATNTIDHVAKRLSKFNGAKKYLKKLSHGRQAYGAGGTRLRSYMQRYEAFFITRMR